MTTLTDLLGTELPIVQAPMAGVQGSALAIAVSQAGALGSLPCAMLAPAAMREELAAVRAGTRGPFNVNFFCHAQPEPDAARERRWRHRLGPALREFGLDAAAIPDGPGRHPFDEAAAELLEAFRPPCRVRSRAFLAPIDVGKDLDHLAAGHRHEAIDLEHRQEHLIQGVRIGGG